MTVAPRTATLTPTSGTALQTAYQQALPHADGALEVITDRPSVEARSNDLQAKLEALGVSDISQEGRLVLGGSVSIAPGLRRGVAMQTQLDTAIEADLDTLPELFGYTLAGRPAASGGVVLAGVPATRAATATTPAPNATSATATQAAPRLSDGRTLVMRSSPVLEVDEAIIVADELQLQDDTELVIAANVKYLTIIAQHLTVGKRVSITWEPAAAASHGGADAGSNGTSHSPYVSSSESAFHSPDGGNGGPGDGGDKGYAGDDAPTLEIWSLEASKLPAIDLQGGKGGTGQRGGDGGDGGDGAKGRQSHSMAWGCDRTVGFGGDGGDGGSGGDGGKGGTGGSGGDLRLYLTDASHEAVLAAGLSANNAGGPGGDPGDPGNGGARGIGGEAGDPTGFWCHDKPERAGNKGVVGSDGDEGAAGAAGDTGFLTAVVITPDDFRRKWTAPQVRTVTPSQAMVGDTVTIDGANFTANAKAQFASVTAHTTVVADTIIQAKVPPLATGWVEVVVQVPGGKASNPGSLKVIPSLASVAPNPAALGGEITLTGAGFMPGCHVLFRGLELDPSDIAADGTTVTVTLPAPQGPFEDLGGNEPVLVRNPDGIATESVDLALRHVLSTGFDVTRNGYAFLNATPLAALANMSTFEDTYGTADVVADFLMEPVLTGAWYAFYTHFFNKLKPGYSSGFSTTAADEYWSGNPDLHADFSVLSQVERKLTVAQGHVLSLEMLSRLAAQALAGVGRAETSLNEIEATFREQLTMTPDAQRRSAPIVQLMPAGTLTTSGFVKKLGSSHGLLPIRVEYPVDGETWEKRVVVYDNAGVQDVESQLVFTRTSAGLLGFVLTPDTSARDTAHGWTLSQASLQVNWLDDVTMPTDYMFILSPVTVVVEDGAGHRFGIRGKESWADLPGAMPAIGAPGLYLLPLDQDLTFSLTGTGSGKYTIGIVSGSLGRSVTLAGVPVKLGSTDTVKVTNSLRDVVVSSTDPTKALTLHYGVAGVRQARALKVARAQVGSAASLTLRATDDLSSFELQGDGPGHQVSVGLTSANDKRLLRQTFDKVDVGVAQARTFKVADWASLGSTSLV